MAQTTAILSAQFDEKQIANSLSRGISAGLKNGFGQQSLRGLDSAFGNITKSVRTFDTALDRANQRVILFAASSSALYGTLRSFQELYKATVQVEKSLISINSVFRLTNAQLDQFSKGLFNVALNTSQSFEKVAEAAQEFSRQGLSAAETTKRTRDAMILTRLAAIDTAEAVTVLTATINGFAKEALNTTQITNKLATVDAAFAVSTKDLVGALTRVGSAASDAGLGFDELIGLVTAAKQITGREGPVIAQALNTIFTRINRKDTIDALDGLGVSVRDLGTGALLPTLTILQNFSQSYDQMTGSIKNQAAELVGGVRNLNTLKAVIGDLAKGNSVYAQAQRTSAEATNQAYLRNEELNTSLEATIQRMGTVQKQIFSNIGAVGFAGPIKTGINASIDNPLMDALRDASGKAESVGGQIAQTLMKGFGSAILFGLGPILAKGAGAVVARVMTNAFSDLKLAAGMTKEQQQQSMIQSQIVALYGQGNKELQQQLALTTSIAERALILKSALESATLGGVSAQRQISAEAFAVSRLGYKAKIPKGAAGGYIPGAMDSERAAIGAGVGGAPAGARPVAISSFNFGGGRRGPLVANTSEFLVPHAAGGTAVYNRDMIRKYGLPAGATPVAAGGFVPNAAASFTPGQLKVGGSYAPFNLPTADVEKLNSLFASLSKAATVAKGSDFGSQITDMANSLEKASSKEVFKKLGEEMNNLANRDFANRRIYRSGVNRLGQQSVSNLPAEIPDMPSGSYGGPDDQYISAKRRAYISTQTQLKRKEEEMRQSFFAQSDIRQKQIGYDRAMQRLQAGQDITPGQKKLMEEVYRGQAQAAASKIFAPGASQKLVIEPFIQSYVNKQVAAQKMPSEARPGLFSRIGASFQNPMVRFGTGMGAAALGGMIDEGAGGTVAGMARGALSSGLQLGGAGMQMGGPIGAAVGAGVGVLYGLISKMSKSFEELAGEIGESKKKLAQELDSAVEVFRIQDRIKEALASGDTATVKTLQQQRATQLAGLDPKYQQFVTENLNSPTGLSRLITMGGGINTKQASSGGLLLSLAKSDTFLGKTGFGGDATKEQKAQATDAITSIIGSLSKDELLNLRELAKVNPQAALSQVGNLGGIGKNEDFVKMLAGVGTKGPSSQWGVTASTALAQQGIFGSINKLLSRPTVAGNKNLEEADAAIEPREKSLITLAASLRRQASSIAITSAANQQIAQARQQVNLANPALTDFEKLRQSGAYGVSNVYTQIQAQKGGQMASGKSELVAAMQRIGVTDESISMVKGIKSLSGLKSLRDKLGTEEGKTQFPNLGAPNSPFLRTLENLINTLEGLDETETENIRATNAINALMERQYLQSQTIVGAAAEDVGIFRRAQQGTAAAISRNELTSVIEASIQAENEAAYRRDLRLGKSGFSERGFAQMRAEGGAEASIRLSREQNRAIIDSVRGGSKLFGGAQLEGALMGEAQDVGRQGKAKGSFIEGFRAKFAGLKQDIKQFAEVGATVANSLEQNLGNAFGNFVTGAQKGKDAFRSFVLGVLGDSARAFASKAVQGLLGMVLGSFTGTPVAGSAAGGFIGLAGGGRVPAMLTGGEFAFGPSAASKLGPSMLTGLNNGTIRKMAAGGSLVRGGSGMMDDVPAMLSPGSFIVKKAMTERYGAPFLSALADGATASFSMGGGLGSGSTTTMMAGINPFMRAGGGNITNIFNSNSVSNGGTTSVNRPILMAGGGLLSTSPSISPISFAGGGTVTMSSSSLPPMIKMAGGGMLPSSIPMFADGGAVTTLTTSSPGGPSGGNTFNIGLTINDNSTSSSSSQSSPGGGSSLADRQFGELLTSRIKQVATQTIEEHTRLGGMLRKQSLRNT